MSEKGPYPVTAEEAAKAWPQEFGRVYGQCDHEIAMQAWQTGLRALTAYVASRLAPLARRYPDARLTLTVTLRKGKIRVTPQESGAEAGWVDG